MTDAKDVRINYSRIRGAHANYTGLRCSGGAERVTINQSIFENIHTTAQPGFDIYAVSGASIVDAGSTAQRTGFPVGVTITTRVGLAAADVV